MNICVLIGNGFDLALGLKTGYKDFIAEYLKTHKESESPDVKWLCETISSDPATWGDAEIAFGKLPFDEARQDALESYKAVEESFSDSLENYLSQENSRFHIPPEEREGTRLQLLRNICELTNSMTSGHREKCRLANASEVSVAFLNFNYTDTLKQILGDLPSTETIDGLVSGPIKTTQVCHVHGTLESGILFGVDAPNQISSQSVRGYCERTGETVKPKGAETIGFSDRSNGVELLNNANVVITFGLSFGASDKSWWRHLWNRVFSSNPSAQLIICPYSLNRSARKQGNRTVRIYADEKKKVFRSFAGENEIVQLESATADRMIVLQPLADEQNPYDYLHLNTLQEKYTKKREVDTDEP